MFFSKPNKNTGWLDGCIDGSSSSSSSWMEKNENGPGILPKFYPCMCIFLSLFNFFFVWFVIKTACDISHPLNHWSDNDNRPIIYWIEFFFFSSWIHLKCFIIVKNFFSDYYMLLCFHHHHNHYLNGHEFVCDLLCVCVINRLKWMIMMMMMMITEIRCNVFIVVGCWCFSFSFSFFFLFNFDNQFQSQTHAHTQFSNSLLPYTQQQTTTTGFSSNKNCQWTKKNHSFIRFFLFTESQGSLYLTIMIRPIKKTH
mgnify:CR=1 FL=1